MTRPQPIAFTLSEVILADGSGQIVKAMVPLSRYAKLLERLYGAVGSVHVLEPSSERNMRFHNFYFAALHEQWSNLPEKYDGRWPDFDQFREWLLVHETNWWTESESDDGLMLNRTGKYVYIYRRGDKIIARQPRSQSLRHMGKEEFEQSAQDVLAAAEKYTGIPPSVAKKEAGRSA